MALCVGIVTKLWKRPALTDLFLRYWAALRVPGARLVRVAAISPDDDPSAWRYLTGPPPGWTFVTASNRPLSAKGNAACQALEGADVAAVVNVGSDDFLSAGYLAHAAELIRAGVDFICPADVTYLSAETMEAVQAWNGAGIGAGRVLSARLLDRLGWTPWNVPQGGGDAPDVDMFVRVGELAPDVRPYWLTCPGQVLDVKSRENGVSQNLSSFDEMCQGIRRRRVDGRALLSTNFPGLHHGLFAAGLVPTGLTGVPV